MIMGYFLPLKFFNVGKDTAICATRVVAIMSTDTYQARETIKAEKRAKTLINAAGRDKVKSAIFLDNGTVVASPLSVKVLMNSIERANAKRVDQSKTKSMVMTVYQEEPNPELDEEEDEMTADYEEIEVEDEID